MKSELSGKINVSGSLFCSKKRNKSEQSKKMQAVKHRKILAGYPIEDAFNSVQDIEKYLSGDKVVCLLCGKDYKALPSHLKVHNYNERLYKEKYRIPTTYGLVGRDTFDKLSIAAKKSHAAGIMPNMGQLIKEKYARGDARKPSQFKSVKESNNDEVKRSRLNKFRDARHEARLQKTHCNKGHKLDHVGQLHCNECSRESHKKNYIRKFSSKEEAYNTYVDVKCSSCTNNVKTKLIAKNRKVVACQECMKKYHREKKKRYREEGRYAEYNRQYYSKKKALIDDNAGNSYYRIYQTNSSH